MYVVYKDDVTYKFTGIYNFHSKGTWFRVKNGNIKIGKKNKGKTRMGGGKPKCEKGNMD